MLPVNCRQRRRPRSTRRRALWPARNAETSAPARPSPATGTLLQSPRRGSATSHPSIRPIHTHTLLLSPGPGLCPRALPSETPKTSGGKGFLQENPEGGLSLVLSSRDPFATELSGGWECGTHGEPRAFPSPARQRTPRSSTFRRPSVPESPDPGRFCETPAGASKAGRSAPAARPRSPGAGPRRRGRRRLWAPGLALAFPSAC